MTNTEKSTIIATYSSAVINVICFLIVDEQYLYKCPDRLRLPLIFYLAHPATLYVNKLLLASLISVSGLCNMC